MYTVYNILLYYYTLYILYIKDLLTSEGQEIFFFFFLVKIKEKELFWRARGFETQLWSGVAVG